MKVYLETLGCRLNYSEMETLGRQLGEIGHEIVSLPEQADVAVLNTCAVTGEAAREIAPTGAEARTRQPVGAAGGHRLLCHPGA